MFIEVRLKDSQEVPVELLAQLNATIDVLVPDNRELAAHGYKRCRQEFKAGLCVRWMRA